jgi:hypothetical protein
MKISMSMSESVTWTRCRKLWYKCIIDIIVGLKWKHRKDQLKVESARIDQVSCSLLDRFQISCFVSRFNCADIEKVDLRIAMNDFADHAVELRKKNG